MPHRAMKTVCSGTSWWGDAYGERPVETPMVSSTGSTSSSSLVIGSTYRRVSQRSPPGRREHGEQDVPSSRAGAGRTRQWIWFIR